MTWPFRGLEKGAYEVISADPPWTYKVFSDKGKARSAENHYNCMSLEDICNLPVSDLAAKDAHLFLWITGPCIVQGFHLKVLEAWGFKPSAMALPKPLVAPVTMAARPSNRKRSSTPIVSTPLCGMSQISVVKLVVRIVPA